MAHSATVMGAADLQMRGEPMTGCSVGIMAYNEEANVEAAIRSILGQPVRTTRIQELIVVASGCEDGTCEIVRALTRDDDRIRLVEQTKREGKAAAINLFLASARGAMLLMASADLVVKEGTVDALLRHFEDPTVGMVGGHPTPVNSEETFLGHSVHLQWRLHDRIAREAPKLGEIVAFRNVVPRIPIDTAVDEISIQALITQLGYRLIYEPEAVVYNRGPATVPDLLRQRRRIYAGHLQIRRRQGYSASTMDTRRVAKAMLAAGAFRTPKAATFSIGAVGLEAVARALGRCDVVRGGSQHVWAVSATTKRGIADGANAHDRQTVAVFHIIDFHRHELELGLQAGRQLARLVVEHVRCELGPEALVSLQRGGTVVALLPGGRDTAEQTVCDVVRAFEGAVVPVNHRAVFANVTLACGLLEFTHDGPPVAMSVPLRAVAIDPVPIPPANLETAA